MVPAGLEADRPRFSPDGRRLVFTRYTRDQGAAALFTTDIRGHANQITSFAIRAGDAVWSRHGEKIVFEAMALSWEVGAISTSSTRMGTISATSLASWQDRETARPTQCDRQMGGRSSFFKAFGSRTPVFWVWPS